jgi:hypothetical protein
LSILFRRIPAIVGVKKVLFGLRKIQHLFQTFRQQQHEAEGIYFDLLVSIVP